MPYRLELSYKDALDGVFAKHNTSYTPLDPFFSNMGAMVTKNHGYMPEIDFINNKHIENIRQLLCLTRDEYLVKKVIIELDDSDSRKEITEGFCELAFIPRILAQITDKADVDLTVGKGKDKNEAEGGCPFAGVVPILLLRSASIHFHFIVKFITQTYSSRMSASY